MRNPFKRRQKALEADPAVIESLRDLTANFTTRLGGTNQRVQAAFIRSVSATYARMYGTSPPVRTVIDLIARNVAQLDLRLYEMLGVDEREPAPVDHPAALSLRFPSEGLPPDQFVQALVLNYLIYGNAYALKFRTGRGGPIRLEVIPASQVEVSGGFYKPEFYRVLRTDGSYVLDPQTGSSFLAPQDVLHWRLGWNPQDPRIGLSPLETLRNVIAEDAANQAANVELLKSGLGERSYVKRPLEAPEWSVEARERFEEDLTNRFKRVDTTPPVLEEGMELEGIGVSPSDAQMLEGRKFSLQQVASLYGVPLSHPAIGLGDSSSAAAEQGEATFYADTLPPIAESLARQLDLSVLQDEFGEAEMAFEFDLDEKLMGDERLKSLTSASGRPVLLTNEARAMVNRPPVDGGDELVTPQNVIVGDKPSVDVMPIQDPNGPSQEGDFREANIAPDAKAVLHPRRRAKQIRQGDYAEEFTAIVRRHFTRQASAGVKSLQGKQERWDRELADDLEVALLRLTQEEGTIEARRFASRFDARQVRNYIRATAEGVAENVNATTSEQLAERDAADVFAEARSERAGTVGGSLAGWVSSHGAEEAGRQSPDAGNRTKTWILNTNRHADVGGETVPLGASFSNGSSPGIPPNCNCVLEVS